MQIIVARYVLLALAGFAPTTAFANPPVPNASLASAPKVPLPKRLTASELITQSTEADWRPLAPANTLYFEVGGGRVIIELAPELAPKTVANVKALAAEHYWDGLAVVRVQDNYVVQWADPNAEKPDLKRKPKSVKDTLTAEFDVALDEKLPFKKLPDSDTYAPETGFSNGFALGRDPKSRRSWLLHCYGAVGVGRDTAPESGNGTELYAVIGQAPRHLDRNVTVIGRVVQGMEYLSSLPRGHGTLGFFEKPEQNVLIRSVRLASEVPEAERLELEVLRTDTKLFDQLIKARRNRTEDWFHHQAGRIDACNMTVPVREKKKGRPAN